MFKNGISRGFGFVTFNNYEPIEKILNSQPHYVDGKAIVVKIAKDREIENTIVQNNNIYPPTLLNQRPNNIYSPILPQLNNQRKPFNNPKKIFKMDKSLINTQIQSKEPLQITKKIFLGGLPLNITKEEITNIFSKFGIIENITLFKGYGFIIFNNEVLFFNYNQESALLLINMKYITIQGKNVEIKYPQNNTKNEIIQTNVYNIKYIY